MDSIKKRSACLMASLLLATGMLTGCGPSGCSSSGDGGSGVQTASLTEAKTVEAELVSFSGNRMVISYDGAEYTLDVSSAQILSSKMHEGDTVVVTYKGELKADDPSACTVVSVEAKDNENADVHELVGTLEDITMNKITVRLIDGRVLTFNANNVKHSFSYGVNAGNWVTIVYHGQLVGRDTSSIAVVEIHDEDTDYVREVKAQTTITDANETFYALEDVDVRSSYMMASEVVGKLKARDSVSVTGRCNNGWVRINYNGQEAYVYGTELTASANEAGFRGTTASISEKVNIKSLDETVYAKADATVRMGYSTASEAVGALKAGSSAKRTGICDNGWSQIRYNGRIAYVYSDLLTTKNPNSNVDGVKITAVNETVYITGEATVRKNWSKDSEALGTLKEGDKIVRTGICDNGWSRVSFNRKDAYIESNLTSRSDPNKVKSVTIYKHDGRAWTTTECNVRASHTTNSEILGTLKKGESVKITGVTDNNWSRIDYNGKVGFVHNDLLTSENSNPSNVSSSKKEDTSKPNASTDEAAKKADEEAAKKEAEAAKKKEEEAKKAEEEANEARKEEEDKVAEAEAEKERADEEARKAEEEARKAEEEAQKKADEEARKAAEEAEKAEEQAEEGTGDQTDGTDNQGDGQTDDQTDGQADEVVATHDIEGIVVGYSLESITIEVSGGDTSSSGSGRATDEPALNTGDGNDEYPSITYDQAQGTVTTYYTFDIRQAEQQYTKGVSEGMTVKVTYEGDLSSMPDVRVVKVTDVGVESRGYVYRGTITSSTENTITVLVENNMESTFSTDGVDVDKSKLVPGAEVKVIADLKGSKLDENILKAIKIEIEKEAPPAEQSQDDTVPEDQNSDASENADESGTVADDGSGEQAEEAGSEAEENVEANDGEYAE